MGGVTEVTCTTFIFFFNDSAPAVIYPLSLLDALPIWGRETVKACATACATTSAGIARPAARAIAPCKRDNRSEEHTSELQSRQYLVCRLLLEKKYNTSRS